MMQKPLLETYPWLLRISIVELVTKLQNYYYPKRVGTLWYVPNVDDSGIVPAIILYPTGNGTNLFLVDSKPNEKPQKVSRSYTEKVCGIRNGKINQRHE